MSGKSVTALKQPWFDPKFHCIKAFSHIISAKKSQTSRRMMLCKCLIYCMWEMSDFSAQVLFYAIRHPDFLVLNQDTAQIHWRNQYISTEHFNFGESAIHHYK